MRPYDISVAQVALLRASPVSHPSHLTRQMGLNADQVGLLALVRWFYASGILLEQDDCTRSSGVGQKLLLLGHVRPLIQLKR